MNKKKLLLTIVISGLMNMTMVTTSSALVINLNDIGGVGSGTAAETGFQAAANLWESFFIDDVHVNIDVGFLSLSAGVLGHASSVKETVSYSDVTNALFNDITSTNDVTSVANLQSSPTFDVLINRTFDNPNGIGSATTYIDNDAGANNSNIRMTTANAKALGLIDAFDSATDATITFNSDFAFDFDDSNGIDSGFFDFVGVAFHEIGHSLGFSSGVDVLDSNSNGSVFFNDDNLPFVSTLDLFRYSAESTLNQIIDWSADNREKYFSIDGGITDLGQFSTGTNHGDGQQAGHWKDNLSLGIMGPTASRGNDLQVTDLDIQALDVIGWDLNSQITSVPEPTSLALLGLGLASFGFSRRKKKA